MNLLIGLILTGFIYYFFAEQIRKNAVILYIGTYILTALVVMIQSYQLSAEWTFGLSQFVLSLFTRGVLSLATFIWVMYAGVFVKQNTFSKKLLLIRGEISIIGCILALGHNLIFGWSYFPLVLLSPSQVGMSGIIVCLITIIAILLMLVLGLTSFKTIRKKMKPKTWKSIQRLAYVFFYLMYIQVMVFFLNHWRDKLVDILIYSFIFGLYGILRIRKGILMKKKRISSVTKKV